MHPFLALPSDSTAHIPTKWSGAFKQVLAHYYNLLIPPTANVLEIGCGDGSLLAGLKCVSKTGITATANETAPARTRNPDARIFSIDELETAELGTFDVILISDTLNLADDVQHLFGDALVYARVETRLLLNFYSSLWRPLASIADALKIRSRPKPSSWLSRSDVRNLLVLSGWEPIKQQERILWPLPTPVIERLVNRWVAPLLPWFCLTNFVVARPAAKMHTNRAKTVSVVVPARNEAGNIFAAVERTPLMGEWTEFIFVEGGSKDNTWEVIEQLADKFPRHRIKILKQTGKGKGNAVRDGFEVAKGEILMILDADLTMPPEDLPKYYHALADNHCEFANGCRLVYPMEKKAMRFLNMVANHFFGAAFSWVLGQHLKDTLCGTKVLTRDNWDRIQANRSYFGDFDPFGDFDMIFGADKLNLKISDIPIRYKERTYGETNIERWKHGLLLLRMLAFAARKLKFV